MQVRASRAQRIGVVSAAASAMAVSADTAFAKAAFPPFDPTFFASQIFWLAISFGALYWLMSRVALPRVGEVLAERSTTIARDLDQATEIHAKVEAVAKDHEQALAESRRNAQAIAQEARTASARETDAKRHATEAELGAKLAAAEKMIADRKTAAMKHVEAIAAGAAAEIVGKLTGQSPTDVEAAAAVKSVLSA